MKALVPVSLLLAFLMTAGCVDTWQSRLFPSNGTETFTIVAGPNSFIPSNITVKKGDTVRLILRAENVTRAIVSPDFGINEVLEPGKDIVWEFVPSTAGTFTLFYSASVSGAYSGITETIIVEENQG